MLRSKSVARGLGFAALASLSLASGAALAQDATTKPAAAPAAAQAPAASEIPIVIVIDTDRIMRESAAGKSVNTEAEKYGKTFEDQSRKEETDLQAEVIDFQKQQGTLSKDQFETRRAQLEQKTAEVRRNELRRRQAFERSGNAAMGQVVDAMNNAAREVALAHHADLVVLRQALMFFNSKFDATQEVLDLMNKKVAKVDFPPPKLEDLPGDAGAQGAATPAAPGAAAKPKPAPSAAVKQTPPAASGGQLQLNLPPQQ